MKQNNVKQSEIDELYEQYNQNINTDVNDENIVFNHKCPTCKSNDLKILSKNDTSNSYKCINCKNEFIANI